MTAIWILCAVAYGAVAMLFFLNAACVSTGSMLRPLMIGVLWPFVLIGRVIWGAP